jgi:hypothetical protein
MTEEKKEVEIEVEEIEIEMPDPYADIMAAANAFNTVEGIDTELMGKKEAQKIKQIRTMSIDIIHEHLTYIHACIFGED